MITPAVQRLRDSLGLPGMLVLQFGFDPRMPRSPHRFANHVENRFVYTGTHDHDTARGWYESIPARIRARVDAELRAAGVWRAGAVVGAGAAGVRLARARGDGSGPGRARARQRGADEQPGNDARKLALATPRRER